MLHSLKAYVILFLDEAGQSVVFLDNLSENADCYFHVERGADHSDERLQLFLLVVSSLRGDQIVSNLLLGIIRQVNVLHGCVGNVDLLLEVCAFSRAHLHEHCHLTKNGSVVDGQDDKDDEDGENLDISPGTHLVTAKREHGSVQADHVLIAHTHLVLVVES